MLGESLFKCSSARVNGPIGGLRRDSVRVEDVTQRVPRVYYFTYSVAPSANMDVKTMAGSNILYHSGSYDTSLFFKCKVSVV